MYFLAEEERRWVHRSLAPQARERGVAEDLRGWNWHRPPLSPIFDTRLEVADVADQLCPTGRNLYLRRVLGVPAPPDLATARSAYLRNVLVRVFLAAKRVLYGAEGDPLRALEAITRPQFTPVDEALAPDESLFEQEDLLWTFEHRRIVARVQDVLARQPGIGLDALVHLALPAIVGQRLDGAFLGLSRHVSADAFIWSEQMAVTVSFEEKAPYHRLTTTGQALAMESLHEYPVNLGCVVYVSFQGGQVLVERDIHHIDDELRQWFTEARDERARLVEEEIDPGLPAVCPEVCPYLRVCHPG